VAEKEEGRKKRKEKGGEFPTSYLNSTPTLRLGRTLQLE